MAVISAVTKVLEQGVSVIVIVLVGVIAAKVISRIVKRVLSEAEFNRILKSAGLKPLSFILGRWVEYVIYAIVFLVVLNLLNLTKLFVVVGVIMIVVGVMLPVVLTLNDFVPNFVAGFFVRKKLSKVVGEKVRIGVVNGVLKSVGRASCVIFDKELHYVPYKYVWSQVQKNNFK